MNKLLLINIQKFNSFEEMKNSINIDLESSQEKRDRRHEKWRQFIKELRESYLKQNGKKN